ncbi:MAG TPA: metallophosphoesterase, partial [Thermoanaerobaculia bacterium]|nr:metallophosphoesterase [Thermoanaerobaculia bacterium]
MSGSKGWKFRAPLARLGSALIIGSLVAEVAAAAPRVVAVGDVHGDLPAFRGILKDAGLVDDRGAWSGGDAVFVQLGDLIDRGPSTRGVLDFVMALEKDAARSGGSVVVLLGNHEVMNMTGDLRYVPP